MRIEIDKKSGFCFGVVRAIETSEQELKSTDKLYCLGDIVHNEEEVKRLEKLGLETIDHAKLTELSNCKVLIRAHGEPPSTYEIAKQNNIQLIDASCPVVLKLQERIRKAHLHSTENKGQIVIYGKKGHAEVVGLDGQTNNQAIIIETANDLNRIDYTRPVFLFAQTTKDKENYEEIKNLISEKLIKNGLNPDRDFICKNTICGQVSNRKPDLEAFAKKHDIIIFVSGKKSSNGKVLHAVCKNINSRTFMVSSKSELLTDWFNNEDNVGICGATSTPNWLMTEVAYVLKEQFKAEIIE